MFKYILFFLLNCVVSCMNTHLAYGAAAIAIPERYWTNGIVPYEIDNSIVDKSPIIIAMEAWRKAGIIFRVRNQENDYLVFTLQTTPKLDEPSVDSEKQDFGGASSRIGRIGGRQFITASNNNVPWWRYAHEIGHTLGLFHEHIRLDRDNWIIIQWQNIVPNALHNYKIKKKRTVDIGQFDVKSIMLYKWNMNAIDKTQATIIWKADPSFRNFGAPVVQALSEGDIQAIHYLYFEGGINQLPARPVPVR